MNFLYSFSVLFRLMLLHVHVLLNHYFVIYSGSVDWKQYPTLKLLMEMVMTQTTMYIPSSPPIDKIKVLIYLNFASMLKIHECCFKCNIKDTGFTVYTQNEFTNCTVHQLYCTLLTIHLQKLHCIIRS